VIGALLPLLMQAAPPPSAAPAPSAATFLRGRFECRIVDSDTKVSTLVFDHGPKSITVVEGAGHSRNGFSASTKVTSGEVGPIRVRNTAFEDPSAGIIYDLSEMIGAGYRANRITILTEGGGLRNTGDMVMAVSRLSATGMCKASPQQERP
jgi:hypothetical protein